MINLGVCAFNYNGWSLEESLRLCRDMGFEYVDVGGGQIGQDAMVENPGKAGQRVREAIEKNGLVLSELFLNAVQVDGGGVLPTEADAGKREKMLERFKAICECAFLAGFKSVMGSSGPLGDPDKRETGLETLRKMTGIATDNRLVFTVETGAGLYTDVAQEVAREAPGLKYTLDYAHHLPTGRDLEGLLPLHEQTHHIHAKPAAPGLFKAFAHHSTTDWKRIMADLVERGWSGEIVMECIAYPVEDAGIDRAAFLEIDTNWQPKPVDRSPISHPVFQTVRLAYELQLALQDALAEKGKASE
ncbi:MAG: sugar phosphate isomerase/epimerase family protein [Candidatus Sumerlaeia bacterium]